LQKLDHKNFVKLLEIYQGENSYYLITDLYAGDTLYRYIKSNPDLDEAQTKIIMKVIELLIIFSSKSYRLYVIWSKIRLFIETLNWRISCWRVLMMFTL
jgi:hypothetical protein